MVGFILLPLAASAAAGASDHIVITDDRSTIHRGLAGHGSPRLESIAATVSSK